MQSFLGARRYFATVSFLLGNIDFFDKVYGLFLIAFGCFFKKFCSQLKNHLFNCLIRSSQYCRNLKAVWVWRLDFSLTTSHNIWYLTLLKSHLMAWLMSRSFGMSDPELSYQWLVQERNNWWCSPTPFRRHGASGSSTTVIVFAVVQRADHGFAASAPGCSCGDATRPVVWTAVSAVAPGVSRVDWGDQLGVIAVHFDPWHQRLPHQSYVPSAS